MICLIITLVIHKRNYSLQIVEVSTQFDQFNIQKQTLGNKFQNHSYKSFSKFMVTYPSIIFH